MVVHESSKIVYIHVRVYAVSRTSLLIRSCRLRYIVMCGILDEYGGRESICVLVMGIPKL
jgi:hypothetical protein